MQQLDRIDVRDVDATVAKLDRRTIFYATIFTIALVIMGGLLARQKILEFIMSI